MRKLLSATFIIGLIATAGLAGSSMFVDHSWTGIVDSRWEEADNWDTGTEPTAADDTFIGFGDVEVTLAGEVAEDLVVADSPFGTASLEVSGAGRLTVSTLTVASDDSSDGTVTVTGDGQMTVSGGVLLGTGDDAIATLNVASGGVLTAGGITMGTNGATATLNVGDGGTAGTLNSDVTGVGGVTSTVNFDHTSPDTTYSGNLTGLLMVEKSGTGTLILTGTNTHSGGTTVSAGTLQGNSDSLQGDIVNNAEVTFDQSADGTYAGTMSGTGQLNKEGAGSLTLTGNNTYTGTTNVTNGSLFVNGSQPSSDVVVAPFGPAVPALVGGTGTVGTITSTGGTVAPGLSPGTLASGSVTFDAASTLEVEIDGTTAGSGYDVLDVTGTVSLGGATLTIDPGFTPMAGDVFVIILNDGADAITGTFSGLAEGGTIVAGGTTLQITYVGGDGNDVALTAIAAVPSLPVGGLLALAALLAGLGYARLRGASA